MRMKKRKEKSKTAGVNERVNPLKGKPPRSPLGGGSLGLTEERYNEIILERLVEEFNRRHINRDSSLNKIVPKKATIELFKLFKTRSYFTRLNNILWHFRLLSKITKQEFLGNFLKLQKQLRGIGLSIDNLQKDSWLSKSEAEEMKANLTEKIFKSNKGFGLLMDGIKLKLKRSGRQKDDALDFLVYCLVVLVKKATGKPKYRLITNFLQEQDVDIIDEEALRRRYKRVNLEELKKRHEFIRYSYVVPFLLKHEDKIPEKLRLRFVNSIIPTLDAFITT